MSGELPRRGHMAARLGLRKLAPEHLLDLLAGNRAKAKQGDVVAVDAEDRRLEPERARTAIEDHGRNIVKLRLDMGGRGRTDATRTVGARCGDGQFHCFQQGTRNRMVRGAQRDGVETTLRTAMAELLVSSTLSDRPAWVRVGAARYFSRSEPHGAVNRDVKCPANAELTMALSASAQREAESRAERCFARELAKTGDWRAVK